MSYCINPVCPNPNNPDNADVCQSCRNLLLIKNRYQLIQRLSNNSFTCTQVFEVLDRDDTGRPKILKSIHNDGRQLPDGTELFADLVRLFKREQEVLTHLECEGIPKGEDYFHFPLSFSDSNEVHCLVMEKIPGQNLEQWLEKHGALKEKQALKWLRQLTMILHEIHQRNWFHRDIKPSNIIRRRNGHLVLIDFGTVKQITGNILNKGQLTRVWSSGYTPPEQKEGQAILQSDFYALGRTFVHLLTGKHPDENISGWRKNTKHRISNSLLTLIDNLMADSPNNRPQNTQAILERLDQIQQEITLREQNQRDQRKRWLIVGVVVVFMLVGVAIIMHLLRPQTCDSKLIDHLSCGEETLTNSDAPPEKSLGLQQVQAGKYAQAVTLL